MISIPVTNSDAVTKVNPRFIYVEHRTLSGHDRTTFKHIKRWLSLKITPLILFYCVFVFVRVQKVLTTHLGMIRDAKSEMAELLEGPSNRTGHNTGAWVLDMQSSFLASLSLMCSRNTLEEAGEKFEDDFDFGDESLSPEEMKVLMFVILRAFIPWFCFLNVTHHDICVNHAWLECEALRRFVHRGVQRFEEIVRVHFAMQANGGQLGPEGDRLWQNLSLGSYTCAWQMSYGVTCSVCFHGQADLWKSPFPPSMWHGWRIILSVRINR